MSAMEGGAFGRGSKQLKWCVVLIFEVEEEEEERVILLFVVGVRGERKRNYATSAREWCGLCEE